MLSDLLTKPCEPWTGVNLIKGPVITRPWIVSLDPGQFWFPSGTYTNWFTGKVNTPHRFQKNHVTTLKLSFDYHFETAHPNWKKQNPSLIEDGEKDVVKVTLSMIFRSFHLSTRSTRSLKRSLWNQGTMIIWLVNHTGGSTRALESWSCVYSNQSRLFFRLLGVEFLRDSPEFLRDSPEDMSLYIFCVYSTFVRFSKSRTTAVETTKSGPTSCASTPRGPPRTRSNQSGGRIGRGKKFGIP